MHDDLADFNDLDTVVADMVVQVLYYTQSVLLLKSYCTQVSNNHILKTKSERLLLFAPEHTQEVFSFNIYKNYWNRWDRHVRAYTIIVTSIIVDVQRTNGYVVSLY